LKELDKWLTGNRVLLVLLAIICWHFSWIMFFFIQT